MYIGNYLIKSWIEDIRYLVASLFFDPMPDNRRWISLKAKIWSSKCGRHSSNTSFHLSPTSTPKSTLMKYKILKYIQFIFNINLKQIN